ncbi:MAG TPA: GNAT family N-acetyltransferase [Aggregatilineales bacterium]|nr:GNAT family N-acetyltransferase [Chloroflexota bacterium]HOA22897.1 GNAT family N-acetyltransferase [Aggregatilineales bacterium]HPV06630.1 GNAT family N-acetyltransferase [Aggregatilineales bacterium]HQA67619.1 GNAT family N-acetyltransferase [Aggregatilineales bacterium]HQE19517.1 GNAT family N-acetyltransferase [Aggregatilineales bacterium]
MDSENLLIASTIMRAPSFDDAEAVADLFNASSLDVSGEREIDVNELRREWQTPGFDLARDARVVLTPEGQIIGYGELWDVSEPHVRRFAFVRVHPAYRGRGIGTALNRWVEQRARETLHTAPEGAQVVLGASVVAHHRPAQDVLESLGFKPVRRFWRMVIELNGRLEPAVWPDGFRVRQMQPGEERAFYHALDEAFEDHWGHVPRPFEEAFEQWMHFVQNCESCDPELFFVVEDCHAGGEIAAAAYGLSALPEDEHMGWVSMLGVRRNYRRRGIALALLRHIFAVFERRGQQRVGLSVDAASLTNATRLYEKAGMSVTQERIVFEKVLREGKDLTRRQVDSF